MKPMVKPKVTLCPFNPAFSTDQVESRGHGGQILCFFEFEGFNDPWRVFFFILQLHRVHMIETLRGFCELRVGVVLNANIS